MSIPNSGAVKMHQKIVTISHLFDFLNFLQRVNSAAMAIMGVFQCDNFS